MKVVCTFDIPVNYDFNKYAVPGEVVEMDEATFEKCKYHFQVQEQVKEETKKAGK